MGIEGLSVIDLKALPSTDLAALLAFGKPVTFRMGTATILAEFGSTGADLFVNLAHIDGGGEGVLTSLRKIIVTLARKQCYTSIHWNVHALTCAVPNPRLQGFLRRQGFQEVAHERYGRILTFRQTF